MFEDFEAALAQIHRISSVQVSNFQLIQPLKYHRGLNGKEGWLLITFLCQRAPNTSIAYVTYTEHYLYYNLSIKHMEI